MHYDVFTTTVRGTKQQKAAKQNQNKNRKRKKKKKQKTTDYFNFN